MTMETGTHDPRNDAAGWVTLDGGGIVPAKLNRPDGWTFDEDRDSAMAAKLAALVAHMDAAVSAWLTDPDLGIDEAEDICRTWVSIRKITQGRDITEGGQA